MKKTNFRVFVDSEQGKYEVDALENSPADAAQKVRNRHFDMYGTYPIILKTKVKRD